MLDDKKLLQSFRLLWNNRSLPVVENERLTLEKAIKADLLDEITHPRLRKSHGRKLVAAINRILQSDLSDGEKIGLIDCYIQIFDKIQKEKEGEAFESN